MIILKRWPSSSRDSSAYWNETANAWADNGFKSVRMSHAESEPFERINRCLKTEHDTARSGAILSWRAIMSLIPHYRSP